MINNTSSVTVALNANNNIEIGLTESGLMIPATGAGLSYANITRVQVEIIGQTTLDSSIDPTYFDLTQPNMIVLILGQAPLSLGVYAAKLRIFTAQTPLGLFWIYFNINIVDGS